MKKYISLLSISTIILLTSATGFAQLRNMFQNKKLPSVEVYTLSGDKVNISTYGETGKITVINFWATWCGPCKLELNNMADLYPDWQSDYDVQIVTVSIDDSRNKAKVKSYVEGKGWEYIVLLDPNQDLKRALNFQTPPYTLLLDQNGNIVSSHTGYTEGDEYILEDKIKALAGK